LSTPTKKEWPEIVDLPFYKTTFPKFSKNLLESKVPVSEIGEEGFDLLSKMLLYDPSKRITAKAALSHPYFEDLDKSKF
jgi:serine/threonine protein kinase